MCRFGAISRVAIPSRAASIVRSVFGRVKSVICERRSVLPIKRQTSVYIRTGASWISIVDTLRAGEH